MSAPTRSVQQLIEDHQGLVRSLAWSMRRSLPKDVDVEDLIGYGQVGLAESARDFDPSLGNQFSTFAYLRIRGAMCDGLGKLMWYSRTTYQRMKYQQLADDCLQDDASSLGSSEPATAENNTQWLSRMSMSLAMVYLATQLSDDDESSGYWTFPDESHNQPESVVANREAQRLVRDLIDALPEEQRQLLQATYYEGLTLQEAGARQGHSKSWASRLHAQALEQLGQSLRTHGIQQA